MTVGSSVLHVLLLVHCVRCSWQPNGVSHEQRKRSVPSAAASALGTKLSPLLARLYAAKRTALQTATSIDSMIAEAMEKERFPDYNPYYKFPMTSTFPYIKPDIVGGPTSFAAAIGAHGGKWFSDARGGSAGQISPAMINTGARRNMAYYTPMTQGEAITGHVTEYEPSYQRPEAYAPVVPNYIITPPKVSAPLTNPSNAATAPLSEKPNFVAPPKITRPLVNPAKVGLVTSPLKPNLTPPKVAKPLANPPEKPQLAEAKKPVRLVWLSKALANPPEKPSLAKGKKPVRPVWLSKALANPPEKPSLAKAKKPVRPVWLSKALANPPEKPSLAKAKKPVRPVWLSKAKPTVAQSTKDPVEDMPSKCEYNFERGDGGDRNVHDA